jgi:hypothetical protein
VNQRSTNDVEIIDAELDISPETQAAIQGTENFQRTEKVRKEHRNRIKRIYLWWKKHYPTYYEKGVRELSEEECCDASKYHHNNKHDLIYTGLNVMAVKAFLSELKRKENGTIVSYSHFRKFYDAILFGAEMAGNALPPSFYTLR